jgi:hypothetical protein
MTDYLATLPPSYPFKSLQDILDFCYEYIKTSPDVFPYGVDRMQIACSFDMVADLPQYEADRARDIEWSRTNGIDWLVNTYNLDGYVCTTNQSQTTRTAKAGYPNVQVPLYNNSATQLTGQVSMTFAGPAFSEPVVIAAAYVAEQVTKVRDDFLPGLAHKVAIGNTITTVRELPDRTAFQAEYDAAVAAYTNDFATQMVVDKAERALLIASGLIAKHTVKFVDWDDKVLSTQTVIDGEAAVAPANPTRDGYIFKGWDSDFSLVVDNITVKALYEEEEVGCNAGLGFFVFALIAIAFIRKNKN